MNYFFLYLSFAILFLSAIPSFAKENKTSSIENISQELVNIRQKIENLHSEISFEKDTYKDQMRSYASQKSDLGVRISRAELNNKDLQRELNKLSALNKEKSQYQQKITPVLKNSIDNLRGLVEQSIPFMLRQRLQALAEIEHRLDANIVSPNKAANQLWAFVEDEFMLGKSSGLYNDTVNLNGTDVLAKVLRIGKIALFFKTPDGQYGLISKVNEQWKQQLLSSSSDINHLETLFDSFSKNIRNGQFSTPNFLPKS